MAPSRNNAKSRKVVFAALVIIALIFGICWFASRQRNIKESSSPDRPSLTKVSHRFHWLIASGFGGELAALDRGIFEKNGLDVRMLPGGYELDPILLVASGANDFASTQADQVILARSKGIPVRIIMMKHQIHAGCVMVRADSGIKTVNDLPGRTMGIKPGTIETVYAAMLDKAGVDRSKIKEIPCHYDMTPFFSGTVEAFQGYCFYEPVIARAKGLDVVVMRPQDYGVQFHGECIIASDDTIKNRPEIVQRYVSSLLEGWQYAIDHPDDAIDIVMVHAPELDREEQLQTLLEGLPLFVPENETKDVLGTMKAEVFASMEAILRAQGLLKDAVKLDEVFDPSFIINAYAAQSGNVDSERKE